MTKRVLAISLFASLALAACGGSSNNSANTTAATRTKNAALPATTTAPAVTVAPTTSAADKDRQEPMGTFDPNTLTLTFFKPVPRLVITWYDDLKQYSGAPWTAMNVTSIDLRATNNVQENTRARLDFYFGTTRLENVFFALPKLPFMGKGPCGFRYDINVITPCSPVTGATYQWFDDFKAIGDPATLTFPADAPATTVNFWKIGPPAGATRVKARFTFAKGGGTEDAFFNVYTRKNDIIITPRKDTINPALAKGTDYNALIK